MSRNWMRTWSMSIGDTQMDPGLRIKFHTSMKTIEQPAVLIATVLNVERNKAASIKTMKGKMVSLNAGYQDNCGLIFKGEVYGVQTLGRETPVDTYVRIEAQTGDPVYNHAYTSTTLKAGSTGMDVLNALMKSYTGITLGYIPQQLLQQLKYPRSRMLYGSTRDLLRELSRSIGATHYIDQFMQLNMVPLTGKGGQGGGRVLNSNNGLLGMPVQTNMGVIARTNMDPSFRMHDVVNIDQSLVREGNPVLFGPEGSEVNERRLPPLSPDGRYAIIAIENTGDNRGMGSDWWTELTCAPIGANGQINSSDDAITQWPGTATGTAGQAPSGTGT